MGTLSPLALLALVVTMATGTMFSVWLGELISEYGVGNGVSFLIFAGIVSRIPLSLGNQAGSLFSSQNLPKFAIVVVVSLLIIALVVFINDAVRKVKIHYARKSKRDPNSPLNSTYLPLKLNQAGVIPIIFAVSLVLVPSLIAQFLSGSTSPQIKLLSAKIISIVNPQSASYNVIYFVLVVAFTYFYTTIVFKPEKVAERLQKNGAFVPGIRPGTQTINYLNFIVTRITLPGAIFLGVIAVLPSILQGVLKIPNLLVGGTSVLIVVSVILEMIRDLQSQVVTRRYEGFVK